MSEGGTLDMTMTSVAFWRLSGTVPNNASQHQKQSTCHRVALQDIMLMNLQWLAATELGRCSTV